ncbi:chord-domain-containing protein [Pluteus cervinus]|uniref:Chord-domain-containing protein n=1 Tax=Pluteus cervinus TaxID=181527 RepID=A0ACD3BG36_9AGAR|nr:chord-domain-containing protein [Pluteus cervinus]
MPRCTRKGCGVEFTEEEKGLCVHHPGVPVFHEGLKSWSCCADVHKPVLDFDEFLAIPGCTEEDHHSAEPAKTEPIAPPKPLANVTATQSMDGTETFSVSRPTPARTPNTTPAPAPAVEEEEDFNVPVSPGTECRRKGCNVKFVSDEVNRIGDGEGTVCTYHPAPPIFREGSKGYLCCKRRVLEFDEFLKITGCKTGRHCFAVKSVPVSETQTTCRVDHYQTLDKVYVSIFAKQVDRSRSIVLFADDKVSFDLFLPGSKRFTKELDLFGPIDPSRSAYQFLNSKVELQLKKQDNRSWAVLEKTENLGGFSLTFGVGGRTGTVGAKDIILDEANRLR